MTQKALILFAHGARAAGWAAPFERLQQMAGAQLPEVAVRLAFLELMTPQLPETLAALVADGRCDITIVPVFLGQGSHLLRDLPLIVDELRTTYPQVHIRVAAAAGENADVLDAITRYCIVSMG
ncbi:CbiX/SirB N-terminal domain-containing protein [Actimicrobium sp. CCC2.4]|uniref:sirohydrochlorin chelatase n=1 Tax=Actimicrobium sp. CCC2.4 TaxID=3048606 RepID=UPI002AC91FD5|nr:CbiX/SirB N-terminal domain-containing protein [Actimicrobium sp. CCC2.4]MEB0137080.1 CbiX/SirB N-terminal domain-containing protein [Actimicrobium sp. CCC2.4]WPX33664.1 CbiX/SirB N-terminal domain-containing protein [Actimicrobium sp. CCC2.4]